jgi:hypothetical protein
MVKIRIPASTVAVIEQTLDALREKPQPCTKMIPRWLPNGEEIQTLSQLAAILCVDEKSAAYVVLDSFNPPAHLWLKADRYVRTHAGAIRYGQPIGSRIVRDRMSWRHRLMAATVAGGITLNFLTGGEPDKGYVVAQKGSNLEVPDSEFFDKDKGIDILVDWVRQHEKDFDKPGAHLGIWHDTEHNEVSLDVSFVIDDRNEALRRGSPEVENQQSIYDIATGETISTGGTGDRTTVKGAPHGRTGLHGEAAEARLRDDGRRTPRVVYRGPREGRDSGGDEGVKGVRHVRNPKYWGAPEGTPLPLAHRVGAAALLGTALLSFLTGGEHGYLTCHLEDGHEMSVSEFMDPSAGPQAMAEWMRQHESIFDDPEARLVISHDDATGKVTIAPAHHSDHEPELPVPEQHTHSEIVIDLGTGKPAVSGHSPDEGDDNDEPETKARHVRDSAFWGAPVGTPLPLARRVKPPVKYRGGTVDAVRRIPKEPVPLDTATMTGAEIMQSAVLVTNGEDYINVRYTGVKIPKGVRSFRVDAPDEKHKYSDGYNLHDYKHKPHPRPVHPLEPHNIRDIKWHWSKEPKDVLYTDGRFAYREIDTVIDTSPPNPKTAGLANAIRMWVEGHPPRQYTRDFPYVGEMRAASAEMQGLKIPKDTKVQRDIDYGDNFPLYSASDVRKATRAMFAALEAAPPEQPDLFRGLHPDNDIDIRTATKVKPGQEFTIPISSFSRDPVVAASYAGFGVVDYEWHNGKAGKVLPQACVVLHIVSGARGIKDDKWIPTDQEVVTGGTFRVLGVNEYTHEEWHGGGGDRAKYNSFRLLPHNITVIDVEQVDVPHAK